MKRLFFPILILSVTLAACGTTQATGSSTTSGNDPEARTLPPLTQIVIGTFKLEGTDQAVTAAQAAELLPLWQVYESLSQSDTSAQAEVDALVEQIQETMTKEQNEAIQAMNLTPEDMFAVMQEQGIEMGGPQATGTRVPNAGQNNQQGVPPGGGFFVGPAGAGGPPGGPGEFNRDSGTGTRSPGSTQNGSGQPRPGLSRIPTPLLNALVELLKERAGS